VEGRYSRRTQDTYRINKKYTAEKTKEIHLWWKPERYSRKVKEIHLR